MGGSFPAFRGRERRAAFARQVELIQIPGRRLAAKDRAVSDQCVAPVAQKPGVVLAQAARQTGQVDRRTADHHLCQFFPPDNPGALGFRRTTRRY